MQFVMTLWESLTYLNPLSLAGWMVWLGLAGVLVVLLIRWRKYQPAWKAKNWGLLIALIVATPLTALFFGLKFTTANALPLPGMPADPPGSTLMLLSAIPWTLA